MKKQCWFTVIAFLFLYAIPSHAVCGMYTYNDLWLDGSGNALGDNYTQSTCGYAGSAYAEVYVQMPSGYHVAASASGSTTAEAIAQSSTFGYAGDGVFSGFNEAGDGCDYFVSSSFGWPLQIRPATTVTVTATQDPGTGTDCAVGQPCTNPAICHVQDSCTAETSPPTCSASGTLRDYAILCHPAHEHPFIAWRLAGGDWRCWAVKESVPLLVGG